MAEFRIPKIEFDQDDLDRLEKLIERIETAASILLKCDNQAAEITKLELIIDEREREIARLTAVLKRILAMDIIPHCTSPDLIKAIKAVATEAIKI